MARVPVITAPCPLRFASMPTTGLDFCGQCHRRVHNLDALSEAARTQFFASCSGEVCVAYTVRRPRALPLAMSLGMAAAGMLAAGAVVAQDAVEETVSGPYCDPYETITVLGGTVRGAELQWVDDSELAVPEKPELPEIDAAEWLPPPKDDTAGTQG